MFLERAIDFGGFILPHDAVSRLREMLGDLHSLEYTQENYNECYQRENEIIGRALETLRDKSV